MVHLYTQIREEMLIGDNPNLPSYQTPIQQYMTHISHFRQSDCSINVIKIGVRLFHLTKNCM